MVSGPLRSFGSSIYIGAREEARDLALFRCHGQWSFEVIWFFHLHRCEGRSTGSSLGLSQRLLVETLHALMVLPVLLLGVGQLLDLPLGLAEVLLAVSVAPVLGVQLGLELADAGVHPGHGLLAALEGVGLGLVHSGLHVLDL